MPSLSGMFGRKLHLGEVYRYGSPETCPPDLEFVDGLRNWFFYTDSPRNDDRGLRFQAGIWNPRVVEDGDLSRNPLIICSSSPHQAGSIETPWFDVIRPDEGYVIYYGDNKDPDQRDASQSRGNAKMLEAMRLQHSPLRADRLRAAPILVVSSRDSGGPRSGVKTVEGLAVIRSADVILQRAHRGDGLESAVFQNIRFDLTVLDLSEDGDAISMDWILARRDPACDDERSISNAPYAWRQFVDEGIWVADRLQRSVMRSFLIDDQSQRPHPGSSTEDVLLRTINFFEHRRHEFESVSARIVERIFLDQGFGYRTGWITKRSGDGGYDFVGCLDLDRSGQFSSTRQVVLGQAKCERSATSGRDVARLAARLRRGWQGAYVTTSTFSKNVQSEIIGDRFPILMVPGSRVAAILQDELDQSGLRMEDYFSKIRERYRELPRSSDPELVLIG